MITQDDFAGVSKDAMIKFNNLGINLEMFDTIVDYLAKEGFLTLCGSRGGCDRACPDGRECKRVGKNCVCQKIP